MTYENYNLIFIVGAILCGVMLLVSVLLFVLLKIPQVINELSGKTARKAIENIRQKNQAGGEKAYKSSTAKIGRIKVEDKMTPSGRIAQKKSHMGHPVETAKISTERLQKEAADECTAVLGGNETTVLGGNETTVLGGNETTVLGGNETTYGGGETTVLSGNETTVLGGDMQYMPPQMQNAAFVIEMDITYIHTNEVIEVGV